MTRVAGVRMALVAVAAVLSTGLTPALAQESTSCAPGTSPRFVFGFAELKAQIGDAMGDPLTCEFPDPKGTGDVHQRTSTGLAFWRKSTNTSTFTDGFNHWALTARGPVTWTGASIDPPRAPEPYPAALVAGYLDACTRAARGAGTSDAATAYCQCTIDAIQGSYSLGQFVDLAIRGQEDPDGMLRELSPVVGQCVDRLFE